MDSKGLLYEKDGALWFKSTDYGDEKDRVLRKSDGTLSYLTPDIANHVYKIERGYNKLVDLWGADHHSYVLRMTAALEALGYPKGTLSVDISTFAQPGRPTPTDVAMSTGSSRRAGWQRPCRPASPAPGCGARLPARALAAPWEWWP